MPRTAAVVLLLLAVGCGGGGGGTTALPALEMTFDFQGVAADVATQRGIGLTNPFSRTATLDLAETPSGPFAPVAGEIPGTVGAGALFSLDVVFTPPAVGAHEQILWLRWTSGSEQRDLLLTLRATAESQGLTLLTPSAPFGEVRIGESKSLPIRLQNTAVATAFTVTPTPPIPDGFLLTGTNPPIGPGQIATLQLVYTPRTLGTHAFQLVLAPSSGDPLLLTVTAQTSTWAPEIVVDFGTVSLSSGDTPWLEFDVPPHAISFTIEGYGSTSDDIGLRTLEGPGGKVYENSSSTGAYIWTDGFEVFTATVPNTDRSDVQLVSGGGRYRFQLMRITGSSPSFTIRVIIQSRPGGVVNDGVLDLNVWLAAGLSVTAASAPSDATLQAVLDETDRILGKRGISLGTISYFKLTNSGYDSVSSVSEFDDLQRESALAPVDRLNVFFVKTALGGGTLGVTGRVGGPKKNGTTVSGLMVDYDYSNAQDVGYVVAHEIGHYIGLFHTTESDGTHDFIDDTVECPASGTSGACPTEGNGYLMHWLVLSVDPTITSGQGRVILGHPCIRPSSGLVVAPLRMDPAPRAVSSLLLGEGWCGTCARKPKGR